MNIRDLNQIQIGKVWATLEDERFQTQLIQEFVDTITHPLSSKEANNTLSGRAFNLLKDKNNRILGAKETFQPRDKLPSKPSTMTITDFSDDEKDKTLSSSTKKNSSTRERSVSPKPKKSKKSSKDSDSESGSSSDEERKKKKKKQAKSVGSSSESSDSSDSESNKKKKRFGDSDKTKTKKSEDSDSEKDQKKSTKNATKKEESSDDDKKKTKTKKPTTKPKSKDSTKKGSKSKNDSSEEGHASGDEKGVRVKSAFTVIKNANDLCDKVDIDSIMKKNDIDGEEERDDIITAACYILKKPTFKSKTENYLQRAAASLKAGLGGDKKAIDTVMSYIFSSNNEKNNILRDAKTKKIKKMSKIELGNILYDIIKECAESIFNTYGSYTLDNTNHPTTKTTNKKKKADSSSDPKQESKSKKQKKNEEEEPDDNPEEEIENLIKYMIDLDEKDINHIKVILRSTFQEFLGHTAARTTDENFEAFNDAFIKDDTIPDAEKRKLARSIELYTTLLWELKSLVAVFAKFLSVESSKRKSKELVADEFAEGDEHMRLHTLVTQIGDNFTSLRIEESKEENKCCISNKQLKAGTGFKFLFNIVKNNVDVVITRHVSSKWTPILHAFFSITHFQPVSLSYVRNIINKSNLTENQKKNEEVMISYMIHNTDDTDELFESLKYAINTLVRSLDVHHFLMLFKIFTIEQEGHPNKDSTPLSKAWFLD